MKRNSIKQWVDKAEAIAKSIKGGKLSKRDLKRAKKYHYYCLFRAGKRGTKYTMNARVDKNQMILPGFLKQQDVVAFQELVLNRLADQLASQIKITQKDIAEKVVQKLSRKTS